MVPEFDFGLDLSEVPADAAVFVGIDPSQADDALAHLGFTGLKQLDVTGTTTGFGAFVGDLDFTGGPRVGFVLSTGRVEDISGENTDAGVVTTASRAQTIPLTFQTLNFAGGVAVAELPSLADGLRSLTFRDDNDRVGGSGGQWTGFDLDAVFLSRVLLTPEQLADQLAPGDGRFLLNDDTLLPKLDIFDFSPGGARLTPGDMRPGGPAGEEFESVLNGMVQNGGATLGRVDYQTTSAVPIGFLSLGDGGLLELELTEAIDTSSAPLYLYTVEAGDVEALVADISASEAGIGPRGDLSTDLGLPGAEGDRSAISAIFQGSSSGGAPVALFDVVILTEELPEFGGADLTDRVSVKINGVEALLLTDGRALTMEALAASPQGGFHPDLVLNLPGTGPLADRVKADAFTTVLTVSAPLLDGDNTLEISVEDGRDGLLDTAIVVLPHDGTVTVIEGTDGDDVLTGTSGDDDVRALFGDDIYTLTTGSDRYDGGVGIDTARTTLAPGAFQIAFRDGEVGIKGGGLDTALRNVELLEIDTGDGAPILVDLHAAALSGDLPILARADAGTVEQGATALGAGVNILDNDLDLGGRALRIVQVDNGSVFAVPQAGTTTLQGTYGTLSVSKTGEVSYQLDAAFEGREADLTDSFGYVVSDGRGFGSASLTIAIEANPDTTPPVLKLDPLKTRDTTPELTGQVDDPDATIEVHVGGEVYKATNLGDGTWVLPDDTVAALRVGPVELSVFATDKAGNRAELRDGKSIEILPNAAPVITSRSTLNTPENRPSVGLKVTATDADGDPVTFSLSGADAALFRFAGDRLRFVTSPDYEAPTDADGDGIYRLTLNASDGIATTHQALTITVRDRNDPLTAVEDMLATTQDAPLKADILANDLDQDTPLSALRVTQLRDLDSGAVIAPGDSYVDLAGGGRVRLSETGIFQFDPDGDFDSLGAGDPPRVLAFKYDATDGRTVDSGAISVSVAGVNDAPVLTAPAAVTIAENGARVTTLAATDADISDTLSYAISGGADAGLFMLDGQVLRFVRAPDFDLPGDDGKDNVYDVQVEVFDGTARVTQDIAVTVTDIAGDSPLQDVPGGTSTGIDRLIGTDADEYFDGLGGPFDIHTGGGGADVFVFVDTPLRDVLRITDYDAAEGDLLDLRGIDIVKAASNATVTLLTLEGGSFDTVILDGVSSVDDINFV